MDNCALPEVCPEHATAAPRNGAGTFGGAIVALKSGAKVARAGWNGKGMHLYLLSGQVARVLVGVDPTAPGDMPIYAEIPLEPCIVMFTAQGKHQPGWHPSTPDVLADDWVIVS